MARDNKLKEKPSLKTLDALWKATQNQFGEDSSTILGTSDIKSFIKWVPLDSPALTDVFGAGLPRGRVIEIWGEESAGKSSLATFLSAQVQRHFFEDRGRYGVVAYIDAEHAFDPSYALAFGLKPEQTLFCTPESAEQALDMISFFQESGQVDLIVLDSVGGLTPQAELDGDMGDAHMSLLARLLSKHLRKITANTTSLSATLLYLNQTRIDIGAWHAPGTPPVRKPLGGNALKFYATIRGEIKRRETIEEKGRSVGIISTLSIKKNKVAPPFKKIDLTNVWGKGFDTDPEYFPFFCRYEIIDRGSTGWCNFLGENNSPMKLQGEAQVQTYLKEHPSVFLRMKEELYRAQTGQEAIKKLEEYQEIADTLIDDLTESDDSSDEEPLTYSRRPAFSGKVELSSNESETLLVDKTASLEEAVSSVKNENLAEMDTERTLSSYQGSLENRDISGSTLYPRSYEKENQHFVVSAEAVSLPHDPAESLAKVVSKENISPIEKVNKNAKSEETKRKISETFRLKREAREKEARERASGLLNIAEELPE